MLISVINVWIPTVNYPDPEHYYDPETDWNYHCQDIWYKFYMKCLGEGKLDCHEKKISGFHKCFAENGTEFIQRRHVTRSRPLKCDKFNYVYSLTKDESNLHKPYNECSRPFVIQRIAHSNLVLLITNRNCNQVFATGRDFGDVPKEVSYAAKSMFCQKQKRPLYRARPNSCMTQHEKVMRGRVFIAEWFSDCNRNFFLFSFFFPQEPKFDDANPDRSYCGRGHRLELHSLIATFSIILLLKVFSSTRNF
jgi:hypothetical protein